MQTVTSGKNSPIDTLAVFIVSQMSDGVNETKPNTYIVFFSSQLLPVVQGLVTIIHHFFILFQLVYGHKVVILHNLRDNSVCYIEIVRLNKVDWLDSRGRGCILERGG